MANGQTPCAIVKALGKNRHTRQSKNRHTRQSTGLSCRCNGGLAAAPVILPHALRSNGSRFFEFMNQGGRHAHTEVCVRGGDFELHVGGERGCDASRASFCSGHIVGSEGRIGLRSIPLLVLSSASAVLGRSPSLLGLSRLLGRSPSLLGLPGLLGRAQSLLGLPRLLGCSQSLLGSSRLLGRSRGLLGPKVVVTAAT